MDVAPSDLYTAIKGRLLTVDAPTFQDSWERCLLHPVLRSGEKPTDVHRVLTSWLTGHDPEDPFLRATFLAKMPGDIKKMLLARTDCTLSQLAAFADTIHSCSARAPAVHRLDVPATQRSDVAADFLSSSSPSLQDPGSDFPSVCAVSKKPAAAPTRPAATSSTGGASSTQRHTSNGAYCWYHARFGVNARSCKPGCSWPKNVSSPGQ